MAKFSVTPNTRVKGEFLVTRISTGRSMGSFPSKEEAQAWADDHEQRRKGGARPGAGRPVEDDSRWVRIMQRYSERETAAIEEAAAAAGMKPGPYVRQIVLKHIEEEAA